MKFLMNYTIFLCPVSFFDLDLTLVVGLWCYNGMLGQMLRFQYFCKIHEISERPYTFAVHAGALWVTVVPLVKLLLALLDVFTSCSNTERDFYQDTCTIAKNQ